MAVDENIDPDDLLATERAARIEAERASYLKDEFLATTRFTSCAIR